MQWALAELNSLIAILSQEVTHLSLGQAYPTEDSLQNLHSALKSLSIQTAPLLLTRPPPVLFRCQIGHFLFQTLTPGPTSSSNHQTQLVGTFLLLLINELQVL